VEAVDEVEYQRDGDQEQDRQEIVIHPVSRA
jgi:hypothetical protein